MKLECKTNYHLFKLGIKIMQGGQGEHKLWEVGVDNEEQSGAARSVLEVAYHGARL